MSADLRPVVAEIDLGAFRHNIEVLTRLVAPSRLCPVVKANAYGHGAVPIAIAAAAAGVSMLAVAIVEEGVELREAGVTVPILVLTEPSVREVDEAARAGLICAVYTERGVGALAGAARRAGVRLAVHLKLDTGMHRVGADRALLDPLVRQIADDDALVLEGIFTHLAVADEPDDAFNARQLDAFDEALSAMAGAGVANLVVHAANSAAAIAIPRARGDLVRCGIACYGYLPDPSLEQVFRSATGGAVLQPVLSLRASVHLVRRLSAGERPSYGRRIPLERDSYVATVLAGYADGIPRALGSSGGEVLINGRRRRIAGTVTMDQIVVDCGAEPDVAPGDDVVLLGVQGDEAITAEEWARKTGTISYEILCGIGPRVPRRVVGT